MTPNPAQLLDAKELPSLETLLSNMTEGVLLLDGQGRVQLVNRALHGMLRLTGNPRGRTLMETFRLNELLELTQRAVDQGQVLDFELHPPGLDKRSLRVNATALRDPAGQLQGIMLVFHDLTRLKELENARQEFVANVSHELRTPLSLIKGYTETLLDGAKDNPAVSTRFLQIIQKHTDRLMFLIEDLLTLSQLESAQITVQMQPVEMRPVVERVREDLAARATEKGMCLENHVPERLWARADSERIQQVFFNLVENATKYGRTQGHVAVGGRPLDDHWVEFWVQDDGPGIPHEARDRIFERFYRLERSRSREQGGTGLGLAIVKHIVQAHGGKVWVESEPGKGATFFFSLPQSQPPDAPLNAPLE